MDDVTLGDLHRRLGAPAGDLRGALATLVEVGTALAGQDVRTKSVRISRTLATASASSAARSRAASILLARYPATTYQSLLGALCLAKNSSTTTPLPHVIGSTTPEDALIVDPGVTDATRVSDDVHIAQTFRATNG